MPGIHLSTAEQEEILRLAQEGWEPKVIARRKHRCLKSVQNVITLGRVKTEWEMLVRVCTPPPTLEEIERRKREIRLAKGDVWETDDE